MEESLHISDGEQRRIIFGCTPHLEPTALMQVGVVCDGDAYEVLRKAKNCLNVILTTHEICPSLAYIDVNQTDEDDNQGHGNLTYQLLKTWFYKKVGPLRDENLNEDKLTWFDPGRDWQYWDAKVMSTDQLDIYIKVTGIPISGFDALRWLLLCCGATEVEQGKHVLSTKLFNRWQRLKMITSAFFNGVNNTNDEEEPYGNAENEEQTNEGVLVETEVTGDIEEQAKDERDSLIRDYAPPPKEWSLVLKRVDKFYDKIAEKADQRYGGAWSTGSCVVGSDMRSGLAEARPIAISYRYLHGLSLDENIQTMAKKIIQAAGSYPFHDTEGYAAGSMMQLGAEISSIRAKNLK